MKLELAPKRADRLVPTPLVHQTAFWGRVQRRLGFGIDAFDLSFASDTSSPAVCGDLLVTRVPLGGGLECAYVPWGPEVGPDVDQGVGPFLERLAQSLRPWLGANCAFIRWDLPWTSLHAKEPGDFADGGAWRGPPRRHLRELRFNIGTAEHNLRKAPRDLLPPDTLLVDLTAPVDTILARMHPKTRYNLGVARRHRVTVEQDLDRTDLSAWYELYCETAARGQFAPLPLAHLDAVLSETAAGSASPVTTRLLLARHQGRILAGMLLAIAPSRATYLYGASTRDRADTMAPYALQWAAIELAKASGCRDYDMHGAAPHRDARHPLAGIHRFKAGFGGALVHREGCWDFPYDDAAYTALRGCEEAEIMARASR